MILKDKLFCFFLKEEIQLRHEEEVEGLKKVIEELKREVADASGLTSGKVFFFFRRHDFFRQMVIQIFLSWL